MQISRRSFLQACSALAINPHTIQGFIGEKPIEFDSNSASASFPLGVASGDVTNARSIVWTRYMGLFSLKLIVWEVRKANLACVVDTDIKVLDGGYVHVDITGLKPWTRYQFVFVEYASDKRIIGHSQVGHFRTAPSGTDLVKLTLGAVSCTHNDYNPVVLEHAGARTDIDVFLLLGDTSYNDGCETLSDFRQQWTKSLSKKGYIDLRASTSVIATLDDHEITDNFDPETIPCSVKHAAIKSYFENTPIRVNPKKWNQIWRSFRFGKTLEIFVLDCRTERRPSTRHSRRGIYISNEQMNWLKDSLKKSEARFKIVMNSVPISSFPFSYESDRWEGYPIQREEILGFIEEEEISGLIWLAGDFHFASVGRVSHQGLGSRQIEILAGPGAQIPNYLAALLNLSPQFDWSSVRNNYMTLTFDPHRFEIHLVYFGGLEDPAQNTLSDVTEIHRQTITFETPCSIRCEGL